jgi:flagellar motility protein MotE (MotC chaperone)
MRLRLLPFLIVTSATLMTFKLWAVVDALFPEWRLGEAARYWDRTSQAIAQETAPAEATTPATDAATSDTEPAASSTAPTKDEATSDSTSEEESSAEGGGSSESKDPRVSKKPPEKTKLIVNGQETSFLYNDQEWQMLQSLRQRRGSLDDREKSLVHRENILEATAAKIESRVKELSTLKTEVQNLLDRYHQDDDAKLKSLVKIYETMKPKEAGKIFEELDMPVLLSVIDRMKESKVAPILGQMNPARAKEITIQLAEYRKLSPPQCLCNE